MEYFRLNQDKRIPNAAFLSNEFQKSISYQDILADKIESLPHISTYFAVKNEYNWFPSVLSKQIFMVTRPVKDIFQLFCPEMIFRTICIVDNFNDQFEYYHVPILKAFDCLSEQLDTNLDKNSLHRIVLIPKKVPETPAFRLSGIKDQAILISPDVAEYLMRRPMGIR